MGEVVALELEAEALWTWVVAEEAEVVVVEASAPVASVVDKVLQGYTFLRLLRALVVNRI